MEASARQWPGLIGGSLVKIQTAQARIKPLFESGVHLKPSRLDGLCTRSPREPQAPQISIELFNLH